MPRIKSKPLVLVVEDDLPMRRYLRLFLTGKGYGYSEAESGGEALFQALKLKPDIILLDLTLPDIDGLEVTKRIRKSSDVPIIVVSGSCNERDKIEVLLSGADDYVTKPFSAEELHARVQVALRRSVRIAAQNSDVPIVSFGGISIDLAKHQVLKDQKEIHLTPTEYRLLQALVKNAGKAVSHRELLTEINSGAIRDPAAYLRVYIMQLRRKLEKQPAKPKYLLSVPGFGFRLQINL